MFALILDDTGKVTLSIGYLCTISDPLKIIYEMTNAIVWSAALAILIFVEACDKKEDRLSTPPFYPTVEGSYCIYSVEEEIFSKGAGKAKSSKWFEKEQIVKTTVGPNGITESLVLISVREKVTDYWQRAKMYNVSVYPDKVVKNLDNESTIALVFPYSAIIKWYGYQHFVLDDQDPRYNYRLFYYEDIERPVQIDSIYFPQTLKVTERVDTTGEAIYRLGYKYYAAGVGLIMDVREDYDYLQSNGEFIGERVIGSGVRRIRKIVGHGY